MDNRVIDIRSSGRQAFVHAMHLLYDNAPGGYATHWQEIDNTLVLFWHEEGDNAKLPYKLDVEPAIDFCWGWLKSREEKDYKEWIDHDGSMGDGFRIFNEAWGHVFDLHYAIMGIQPIYAWYGK